MGASPPIVQKSLSGGKPTEKQMNPNMYSRIHKQIMMEKNRRIRLLRDQVTREEESAQKARLISVGGNTHTSGYRPLQRRPDGG